MTARRSVLIPYDRYMKLLKETESKLDSSSSDSELTVSKTTDASSQKTSHQESTDKTSDLTKQGEQQLEQTTVVKPPRRSFRDFLPPGIPDIISPKRRRSQQKPQKWNRLP